MSDSFFSLQKPKKAMAQDSGSSPAAVSQDSAVAPPVGASAPLEPQLGDRIAFMIERIREQAERSIPRGSPVRTVPRRPGEWTAPEALEEQERIRLTVVTDAADRPLVCLPPELALEQGLYVRMVAVAVFSHGGRLFLQQGVFPHYPSGIWNICSGFVRPDEAREDTALRLLQDFIAVEDRYTLRLTAVCERHALPPPRKNITRTSANRHGKAAEAHISLFSVVLPSGIVPEGSAGSILDVDEDELAGLTRALPELLSSELVWAVSSGMLFPRRAL